MMDYRRRIYDRYSSDFKALGKTFDAAAADRWGKAYDRFFRGWLPGQTDARIIDLACGSGGLLRFFKLRGYQNLAGVDLSPQQVALARQVTSDVVEGDVIAHLIAHEAEFDLITALDIIEHLHKDEVLRFLDGCARALKPGGRLILQTPNAESPWFGAVRYADFTHEVAFTAGLLGRLLEHCGLRSVEAREAGPVAHGVASSIRLALWQAIRLQGLAWRLIETGTTGSGLLTQVFLISAVKGP